VRQALKFSKNKQQAATFGLLFVIFTVSIVRNKIVKYLKKSLSL
jgi:hypothetical protein